MDTMSDTDRRDDLAAERTRLANERTLLAYVRTALALAGAGALLLHFLPTDSRLLVTAWGLMVASAVTLVIGIYRCIRVARRLRD